MDLLYLSCSSPSCEGSLASSLWQYGSYKERRVMHLNKLALAALFVVAASSAQAQSPALGFIGYTPAWEYTQDSYVIGWYFQVNTPVTVSALGWYNDSNGLSSDHPVGLYDMQGNDFVATTTVAVNDPLTGVFRYHDLASPVNLIAGDNYAMVGVSFRDYYLSFAHNNNIVTDPAITYLGGAIDYAGGATHLSAPLQFYPGQAAWPASDLLITATPTTTPEPGSVALILSLTMTGAGFLARRRKKAHKAL